MSALLPQRFENVAALEDFMTRPSAALVADLAGLQGDILILGVAGKMGPTLARLAKRAAPHKRIVGVARFSDAAVRSSLAAAGVETIACDLLDRAAVAALPRLGNVVYMAGMKFGAAGDPAQTWAMNVLAPAIVAETFQRSRIVAFSTGCVYPFVPVGEGGAREEVPARPPPGDYAYSCLGRERIFAHFSARLATPGRILRLNYAIDMRYGVLHDVAVKVRDGETIDLTTGHVNVIWQGDANAVALRALARTQQPTTPINVTGCETISVRWLAEQFGLRLARAPRLAGAEAPQAWLSNPGRMVAEFGAPSVPLAHMIAWTAEWVAGGKASHGKPTRYEVRDGRF
jgi:nucleoside-diphosphate-sugar epimerase